MQLLKPRHSGIDVGMRQSKEAYKDNAAALLPRIASVHSIVGTAIIKQRSVTDQGTDPSELAHPCTLATLYTSVKNESRRHSSEEKNAPFI